MLRLEVLDYAGPTRWRWRLTTPTGAFVADHVVTLDPAAWQHEAFLDLRGYLHSYAAPDRREEREAELLVQVGDWLTESVLGPVAGFLAAHSGFVGMELPAEAAVLGYLPWELARVDGRTLASSRVTFMVDHQPRTPVAKRPIGERLRMLAIFSLPEGAGALNLRKERYALARLVHTIAQVNNKAVELRVLQYGATRQRLSDALLEADGWDVVHLSGHGLPAGVVLETSTGARDLVTSTELVDLLEEAASQIKLVTLSACSSAAVTAEEHLSLLGFSVPTRAEPSDEGSLPAVATEVVRRLDCAVVAMRYPVIDEFAIALAGEFYDLVLGKGHPVARALSLARSRVKAVTALSAVTPTLFGFRAADLVLSPPAGEPVVFQPERAKLAEFPPQPERFVGRVGPMTRATTALAPHSGKSGILFHGMAGGGKTACAVELAYTHQDSFPRLAWYAALGSVSTALTEFALALERQLPGLKLVHLVNDIEAFRRFLPTFTEVLEQQRVLIVLDNAETLLTDDGQWRDERWSLLINAMTAHKGLSRLVITSRVRPVLPDSVVVEAVHALSLREVLLLAREWPCLLTLMDEEPELAVQVLTTVQGHPKLVELANGLAVDREALRERLEQAQQAWMERGARLEPFLRGDDPAVSDTDYLSVLADWTRAAVGSLPEQAREVFLRLCCTEDNDRRTFFNPDAGGELAVLADRGLIEIAGHHLRIHPGVAETGRAMAGHEFARSVDEEFADMWVASLTFGRDREQSDGTTSLLVDAAVGAAPYLHRLGRWEQLGWVCEAALGRDSTPAMVASLLPFLEAAAEHSVDLPTWSIYARALCRVDQVRGRAMLRDLLARAVSDEQFAAASTLAYDLISGLRQEGRLDEALALSRQAGEYTRRAGLGRLSQAHDECVALQIRFEQGAVRVALDGVRQVLAGLPEATNEPENVMAWTVREALLNLGANAAATLGDQVRATEYAEELFRRKESRGASPMEQVVSRFNAAALMKATGRVAEAREALVWCRGVCEQHGDIDLLGQVIGALADLEDELGRTSRAIELKADALRLAYLAGNPVVIGMQHHDFAALHSRVDCGSPRIWAHYLASALIAFRIGHRTLDDEIGALARFAFAHGLPERRSFDDICALVEETEGVRFRDLYAGLPPRESDEVLSVTNRAVTQANAIMQDWTPIMSAVVLTASGRHDLTEQLQASFHDIEQNADAVPLVRLLRRILAGERSPELLDGLPPLAFGIVRNVLVSLPAREGS